MLTVPKALLGHLRLPLAVSVLEIDLGKDADWSRQKKLGNQLSSNLPASSQMSALPCVGRSSTYILLSWNPIPISLGNFSIHRKRKLHLLHRLSNMIMHQWLMPTDFQVLSPWLLQRFASLITVTDMRLLLDHSFPINLECYFYEASKRRTLHKSLFQIWNWNSHEVNYQYTSLY